MRQALRRMQLALYDSGLIPEALRQRRAAEHGITIYEMVRDLNKERGMIERLFILVVFGDVLGVPILPPYYALRLLPYVVPNIEGWRYSLLRERDLTDLCDQEIT